jgi:hypothetical protein
VEDGGCIYEYLHIHNSWKMEVQQSTYYLFTAIARRESMEAVQ